MNESSRIVFPFTRIVGQNEMKTALLLNVVDPGIGGVLIRGSKGTAKSTAVRSMSQFLPAHETVSGCRFGCDPDRSGDLCPECAEKLRDGVPLVREKAATRVVELPLNATEDRVAGTLDLEHVLETGRRRFEPGVLASANGNILYVDEINLLDDHIIDLLLDSAAMGRNYIEREGVSFSHPSRFVLVGTMNPEEGELRPQLLDRFGLSVEVKEEYLLGSRMEVIKRRMEFESDPERYVEGCADELDELRTKISEARARMRCIPVDDDAVRNAAKISSHFKMEGHRADLALIRASRAKAALDGRSAISREDFIAVSPMVLTHRLKKSAFEKASLSMDEVRRCLDRDRDRSQPSQATTLRRPRCSAPWSIRTSDASLYPEAQGPGRPL